jgi:hypothetical protein
VVAACSCKNADIVELARTNNGVEVHVA